MLSNCAEKTLEIAWTARRWNQSILKAINAEYSLKGLLLKLMLHYNDNLCKQLTHWEKRWYCERQGKKRRWWQRTRWLDSITDSMNMDLNKVSSVQFSSPVVSDCLQHHESQHVRPPYPSLTPGIHSNSFPLSQWCHPTISSSVIPFFSCPQSLPASGSFPMSQLFAGGGQSVGVSVSASVLPMNTQDWSHLGWTGWISLQSKGLSRVLSNITVQKHQFFGAQLSSQSNFRIHTWPLEKP